jgi:NTP pyrophosphatase (non-canonical NTP hydrolase)
MSNIDEIISKCQEEQELKWGEYVVAARRTASGNFYGNRYRKETAIRVLKNLVKAGNEVDKLKKALFYGKDIESTFESHYLIEDGYPIFPEGYNWETTVSTDIIHAVLGIATEAVELIEALITSLEKDLPLDEVNTLEELGDVFWYVALFNLDNKEFNRVLTKNILKLHVRYPEKFTEDKAVSRNLDKELEVLT